MVGSRIEGSTSITASRHSALTLTSSITRSRASSTERSSRTSVSMRSRLAGLLERIGMGVEPGRGAHQLVDDHQAIGLERLAGRHVVDDAVGVLGREHLGRTIGMHEGRARPRRSSQASVRR